MVAFAAPYSMMLREIDNVGMYDTAAEEMGKVVVSTELGGGGSATAHTVRITEIGAHNFLVHGGIKAEGLVRRDSIFLNMPSDDCFTTSEHDGLLEACVDLGEIVHAGDLLARVYDTYRTGRHPIEYYSQIDGILTGRHFPGLVRPGDTIAVVAVPK